MSFPQLKGWERRMKNIDKSLNITRNRILAACGAIVIVIAALLVFMNVNTNRITSQNADYLEGTTEQTTRRVNDLLSNGLATVQTAAKVYSQTLTSPNVDPRQAVQTIELASQLLDFDCAGGYCALLTASRTDIYDSQLRPYASLEHMQGTRYLSLSSDGSAILSTGQQARLFIP